MKGRFARFVYSGLMGWKCAEPIVPEKNCVILMAPHTSMVDFVIGYLYYRAVGGKLRIMIKKELFFFPLGPILRALGGFPIDRRKPAETIMSVVHQMKDNDKPFHLVICPEGTRGPVHKWKTGYHTIATQTGAPVYLARIDYKEKYAGRGQKVELLGSPREDTDRIQQLYEDMHLTARHPEKYCTK